MTRTDFDWQSLLSAPRYFCGEQHYGPWAYRRADGTEATALGTYHVLMRVRGAHAAEVHPADERLEFGRGGKLCGDVIENIFAGRTEPVGRTTVADLRAALGEPAAAPVEAERECGECGGRGEVECFACGHEHECEDCDGTGKVNRPEHPEPVYVSVAGRSLDERYLAPLLAGLPDGPVYVRANVVRPGGRVIFVGDGWEILCVERVSDDEPGRKLDLFPLTELPGAADQT